MGVAKYDFTARMARRCIRHSQHTPRGRNSRPPTVVGYMGPALYRALCEIHSEIMCNSRAAIYRASRSTRKAERGKIAVHYYYRARHPSLLRAPYHPHSRTIAFFKDRCVGTYDYFRPIPIASNSVPKGS